MCIVAAWGSQQKGKVADAIYRPHRMFGLRGPLEFMLHPNDKYNAAKTPTPETPPARTVPAVDTQTVTSDKRRRQVAGVLTGTLGSAKPPNALAVGGY